MAQSNSRAPSENRTEPSAEEFQRKLHRWFEEQGLLSDLRAHMRQLMMAALRGTELAPQAGHSVHQNTSPKIQAINLLVAEFLLLQNCHYTLSVFTSEVPLLRNLPEFSPSFKDATKNKLTTKKSGEANASPSKLQERHVWDILEALGFSPDSRAGNAVFKSYQDSNGEPLLTCLIRSVSKVIRLEQKEEKPLVKTEEDDSVQNGDSSSLLAENSALENEKNNQKISSGSMPVIHEILQKLNVKPKYIIRLENEIKRLMQATQLAEKEYFHEKLLSHEKHIQEERAHYEKELYSQIMLAQQQLVEQSVTADTGLGLREAQVMAAAEKLQQKLKLVEETDKKLKEREQLGQKIRKKDLALAKERKKFLDNRQQEIRNTEKSKMTVKVATDPSVHLVESLHDTVQMLEDKSLSDSEEDINEGQWQMSKASNKSQPEGSVSSRDQSVQVGRPGWQVISDLEEVRATVQQLQQENEELRNLMCQQQEQVSELRAWGQVHMTASVSGSPAQTQLVAPADLSPYVPPPPLPPREPQQPVLCHPAGEELHFRAVDAACVTPASTQTPRNGRSRTRRLRRFPASRLVVPSSDETSPTEEMLRDARRRLRELEEESEAVDRSYREFCLRQQRAVPVFDVLAGILQPPPRTEGAVNSGATAKATGDPSGLKLLEPLHATAGHFSSGSLVTAVTRTETEGFHIVSEVQLTSEHHDRWPTVSQNSNVCLSDLIYNIPSSELVLQPSVTTCEQGVCNPVAETHTDCYQTAKMQAHGEVHTTHIHKAPLLSSVVGTATTNAEKYKSVTIENIDSGCGYSRLYNKQQNKLLNSREIHEGIPVSEINTGAPDVFVRAVDNAIKILEDSQRQRTHSDKTGDPKPYEQKPHRTLLPTDLPLKSHTSHTVETESEGKVKVLYEKTTENDAQLMEIQVSSEYSLKATELSNPCLSDLIMLRETSKELQDENTASQQEKGSKKDLTLHNFTATVSEKSSFDRSSLDDAEFIPASSGDQLFVPRCSTDTKTDPGSYKSDMLPGSNHQNRPFHQAISNTSISSEHSISAGKSTSSAGNDFW